MHHNRQEFTELQIETEFIRDIMIRLIQTNRLCNTPVDVDKFGVENIDIGKIFWIQKHSDVMHNNIISFLLLLKN